MSVEEDAELKNLVAQTLENKGILPKIRAELRANVFLALEENPATKETLLRNEELSAFVKIPFGTLILNLIREFLEFFELEFTLSVFDPETKYGKEYCNLTKEKMMKELKITDCQNKNPLLCEVIERVINSKDLTITNSEKNLGQKDIFENGDTGQLIPSSLPLNTTFVKNKAGIESLSLSPVEKEKSKEDENDTIKEELTSNYISDSDSLAELNLNKSSVVESTQNNLLPSNRSKDSKVDSPKAVPKNPDEFDLLIFTPVKETKPRETTKSSSSPVNEAKTNEKKENEKPRSVLGDLPPLTLKADERSDKINKIKAIIDKWPGLDNDDEYSLDSKSSKDQVNEEKSPHQSKSERSEPSQKSSAISDEFEEDISDLINGHTPLDGQFTIDETISKASCEADYLESV